MRVRLPPLCLLLLLLPALAVPAVAQDAELVVPAGGQSLRVEALPFRLVLTDAAGREAVATVPGLEGAPVRLLGAVLLATGLAVRKWRSSEPAERT